MSDEVFMTMWTVYEHPKDFPELYVAREFHLLKNNETVATREVFIAPTLEIVRGMIPPGLACLHRYPDDDPCIVEVWL